MFYLLQGGSGDQGRLLHQSLL